jgi:hypothetical protein
MDDIRSDGQADPQGDLPLPEVQRSLGSVLLADLNSVATGVATGVATAAAISRLVKSDKPKDPGPGADTPS